MKPTPDEPLSLGEAAREDARLRPLARLVRGLPETPSLDDVALARVFARVREARTATPRLWFGFRLAPAAAILLLGTTVGASAALVAVKLTAPPVVKPAADDDARTAPRAKGHRRAARPALAPPEDVGEPETLPEAQPTPVPAPAPRSEIMSTETPREMQIPRAMPRAMPQSTARPTATLPPKSASADLALVEPGATGAKPVEWDPAPAVAPQAAAVLAIASLAEQSDRIGAALSHLRRDHQPERALVEIDTYLAAFPSGVFRDEAALARAEALLALGRRADALAALEALGTRRPELVTSARLLRAEILSATRCQDAIVIFTEILVGANVRAVDQARALHGRALSRVLCGDETGGRADLKQLLDRFPDGAPAADARLRLGQ